MADYPDKVQVIGTQMTADDGTVMERAVSGRPRLRSFFTDVQLTANVVHEFDGPDKDDIWNHYLTHRAVAFNFVYHGDSQTYVVRYFGPPERVPIAGTDRWRVTTRFVVY